MNNKTVNSEGRLYTKVCFKQGCARDMDETGTPVFQISGLTHISSTSLLLKTLLSAFKCYLKLKTTLKGTLKEKVENPFCKG